MTNKIVKRCYYRLTIWELVFPGFRALYPRSPSYHLEILLSCDYHTERAHVSLQSHSLDEPSLPASPTSVLDTRVKPLSPLPISR